MEYLKISGFQKSRKIAEQLILPIFNNLNGILEFIGLATLPRSLKQILKTLIKI